MARCHLVIGLCVLHLCLAFAYPGFQYDPNLIPQAAPQYYPQQNPYAQYPSPYPMYEGPGAYYPQPGYGQQPVYGDREVFIQENEEQTPTDTGASEPTSSGTNVPADTAVVQTPSQTEDSTGSSSPSTPTTNSNMDALDIQLAAALEAVKADMISKGKQVLEEKQWTDDVKAVIEQYTKKISNVYANIEKLKKDMGDLYRKKQQIINAQIQKQLTAKLKDSKSDLQTVQAALDKVTNTQMEFEQSKKDIQSTIDSIFAQLAELKGQPAPAASGETPAAGTDAKAGGTDSTKSGSDASSTDSQSSDAAASSDSGSSDSETDIVDRTAEINSKIDTIKSIVSALNKGSSSSL